MIFAAGIFLVIAFALTPRINVVNSLVTVGWLVVCYLTGVGVNQVIEEATTPTCELAMQYDQSTADLGAQYVIDCR